jgi:hypothetical protein
MVAQHHVASVGQRAIGNDRGPAIEIEWKWFSEAWRRYIENDGGGKQGGEPRRRRIGGRRFRLTRESTIPICGPSPPVRLAVHRG